MSFLRRSRRRLFCIKSTLHNEILPGNTERPPTTFTHKSHNLLIFKDIFKIKIRSGEIQ